MRYLNDVFVRLFDSVPPNTYITVTADYGELFGEEGYFGHGPINHEKVYEVPFVEGKIRQANYPPGNLNEMCHAMTPPRLRTDKVLTTRGGR